MNVTPAQILRTYLTLTVLSTLAASFIWGINTLFLLDAGLTITQAFAANAFFTAGQVLFEVPTGIVADTLGRRTSNLLGSATLLVSTLLYLLMWQMHGPFWSWALTSALLGLGFTFFSGATEAWLVDGLNAAQYKGKLESVFAKGQVAGGAAMLIGTLAGGIIAEATNLGVPYILRAAVLGLTFIVAFAAMRDVGFTPKRGTSILVGMRSVFRASLDHGLRNPPVRWLMLAAPFGVGVGFYVFYAMQPYLLQLYGRRESYAIAGLAAAIVAGAQIIGGLMVPLVRRLFRRRTTVLIAATIVSGVMLLAIGLTSNFLGALVLLAAWGTLFAVAVPLRQAYLNGIIPSAQRATVLSSDSLLGSAGGVIVQPAMGRVADVSGYATSYVVSAAVELLALPFLILARRERAPSDSMHVDAQGPELPGPESVRQ